VTGAGTEQSAFAPTEGTFNLDRNVIIIAIKWKLF
jgi:hypothetical protein